jgi:hypothetical protein
MGYDEVLFSDATDRIDRLLSETFGIALSLHRSGDDAFRNDLANSRGRRDFQPRNECRNPADQTRLDFDP